MESDLNDSGFQLTPLMRAAGAATTEGNLILIELVALGHVRSSLFVKDSKGRTALDWARLRHNDTAIAILTKAMGNIINDARMDAAGSKMDFVVRTRDVNEELSDELISYLVSGDKQKAVELIKSNHVCREDVENVGDTYFVDKRAKSSTVGNTPLIIASGNNFLSVVTLILESAASEQHLKVYLETTNKYGYNALTWAATCGHADIVRLLLFRGTDYLHTTVEGWTVLHCACRFRKGRVVQVILEYLYEQFAVYQVTRATSTEYDSARWDRYATMLEKFIHTKDKDDKEALDYLLVVGDGKHVVADEVTAFVGDADEVDSLSLISSMASFDANAAPQLQDLASQSQPDAESALQWSHNTDNYLQGIPGLTDEHSIKTSLPLAVEIRAIQHVFRQAEERIAHWKHCASKDADLAALIPCWLHCGYHTTVELMSDHMKNNCPFHALQCKNCGSIVRAQEMPDHLNNLCPKRVIGCPNAWHGCTEMIPYDFLEKHLLLRCPVRLCLCRLNCGISIALNLRENHELYHCSKREMKCDQCQEIIISEDYTNHLHNECPERLIRCSIGCGVMLKAKDLENHELNICQAPCKWGCGLVVGPQQKKNYHELFECSERPCACTNDPVLCTVIGFKAKNIKEHVDHQCVEKLLPCPNGCGKVLPRKDIARHIECWNGDCTERYVRCPSNLVGWKIRHKNDREGIVLKYERHVRKAGANTSVEAVEERHKKFGSKWCTRGVDQLYVRFDTQHEWINYWDEDNEEEHNVAITAKTEIVNKRMKSNTLSNYATILPLCKILGDTKIGVHRNALFTCGWRPFSQINHHLEHVCANRAVLVPTKLMSGGHGTPVKPTFTAEMNLSAAVSSASQSVKYSDSLTFANLQDTINEFDNDTGDADAVISCEFCSEHVIKEEIQQHIKDVCGSVIVRCSLGCGLKMSRKNLKEHVEKTCPKRTVPCPECFEDLWAEEVEEHLKTTCEERAVPCQLGCGITTKLTRKTEIEHRLRDCPHRMVVCTCSMKMMFKELNDHYIADCVNKLSLCPQGCGQMVPRDTVDEHIEKHCANKRVFYEGMVTCPIGCGLRMKRKAILGHVSYVCPMRLTDCPLKCGNCVKFVKMKTHMYFCPMRLLTCEHGMVSCNKVMYEWFRASPSNDEGTIATVEDLEEASIDEKALPNNFASRTVTLTETDIVTQDMGTLPNVSSVLQDFPSSYRNEEDVAELQEPLGTKPLDPGPSNIITVSVVPGPKPRPNDGASTNISNSNSSVTIVDGQMYMKDTLRLVGCRRHGATALLSAVRANEYTLAEFIVRSTMGMDLDVESDAGDTALTLSCRFRRLDMADLLIRNGSDVNMENRGGRTPLIEAVKAGCHPIVDMLITNGASVKYKTFKHRKSAMDWAKQLKLGDIMRSLEMGHIVQGQAISILHAVSCGDIDAIRTMIQDGDLFDPNISYNMNKAMEEHIELLRTNNAKVEEVKAKMKAMELIDNRQKAELKDIGKNLNLADKDIDGVFKVLREKKESLTGIFVEYEQTVNRLTPSDLEEIARMRKPSEVIRMAALAYGILLGLLQPSKSYAIDMVATRVWWPVVVKSLVQSSNSLKRLKAFSLTKLQTPAMTSLLARARELHRQLCDVIKKSKPLPIAKNDADSFAEAQSQSLTLSVITDNDTTAEDANNSQVSSAIVSAVVKAEKEVIPAEDWDSDDDGAWSGSFVKGEWVAVDHTKKNWWEKRQAEKEKEAEKPYVSDSILTIYDQNSIGKARAVKAPSGKASVSNTPISLHEEKVGEEIYHAGTPTLTIASKTADDDDDAMAKSSEQFVETITTLLMALDEMAARSGSLAKSNREYNDVVATHAAIDMQHNEKRKEIHIAQIKYGLLEQQFLDGVKIGKRTLKQTKRFRERLRVSLLLNQVTNSGHTPISWAAAHGNYEAVELMLSHGATVGYTEDLLHLSASFIQMSYRLYRFMCCKPDLIATGADKENLSSGFMNAHQGGTAEVNTDMEKLSLDNAQGIKNMTEKLESTFTEDGDEYLGSGTMSNTELIEKIFDLKELRSKVLKTIRFRRNRIRLPLPEAAFGGKWEIIERIHERKMFHYYFSNSWIYPSPPPPRPRNPLSYPRSSYRLDCKYKMMELLAHGMSDLAAGEFVDGIGWVGPNNEQEAFGESQEKIGAVWEKVCKDRLDYIAARQRIRYLINERRCQQQGEKDMVVAIRKRDFKQCMYLSTYASSTIDYEISETDGTCYTALIAAAEENIGGLHHAFLLNDDGIPVLAVEYLLDRDERRPSVDLEVADGFTALIKACSLNRIYATQSLLDRGATVNKQNRFGKVALHYAAAVGSYECVRMLLERGADMNIKDCNGQSSYDLANEMGFTRIMQLISQFSGGFLGPVRVTRGRIEDNISCPLGCGLTMFSHERKAHVLICPFREVECPLKCGVRRLMEKEVEGHTANECEMRLLKCEKCEQQYVCKEEDDHMSNKCPQRVLYCSLGCGNQLKQRDMPGHQAHCTWRMIQCTLMCGQMIKARDSYDHNKYECENRRISCTLRCSKLVVFKHMKKHLESMCPFRPVSCQWCNEPIKYIKLTEHEHNCNNKLNVCPAKCGSMVAEEDMAKHLADECNNRFVSCPLQCPLKIRFSDLPTHTGSQCEYRIVICPLGCSSILETAPYAVVDGESRNVPLCAPCTGSNLKKSKKRKAAITRSSGMETSKKAAERLGVTAIAEGDEEEDTAIAANAAAGAPPEQYFVENGVYKVPTRIRANVLPMHLLHDCQERMVKCCLCSQQFRAKDIERHSTFECSNRLVNCRIHGCIKQLPENERDDHERFTCRFRLLPCSQGCGENIVAIDMGRHVSKTCSMRHVQCPLQCDAVLRQYQVQSHLETECSRRFGADNSPPHSPLNRGQAFMSQSMKLPSMSNLLSKSASSSSNNLLSEMEKVNVPGSPLNRNNRKKPFSPTLVPPVRKEDL